MTRRNALVYAAFALGVVGLQLGLFATVDETALPVFAPLCLLGLPAIAWAAGWLTIGLAFRPEIGDEAPAAARTALAPTRRRDLLRSQPAAVLLATRPLPEPLTPRDYVAATCSC